VTDVGDLPRAAIALLNWNGWRDTIACLDSLDHVRYTDASVVLCDNCSTDDSVDRIARWGQERAWPCRVVDHLAMATNAGRWRAVSPVYSSSALTPIAGLRVA